MRRLANQLEAVRNSAEDSAQWRRALLRAQKELIAAQEVGDEKLHIMSQLQEHIDNKVRQMDIDLRNLGECCIETLFSVNDCLSFSLFYRVLCSSAHRLW